MPVRKLPLVTDEFYHVFNRGVAKQPIFTNKGDYQRFVLTQKYYLHDRLPFKLSRLLQLPHDMQESFWEAHKNQKDNRRVDIVSYVLMPNHFHFLLKQRTDNGISSFIRRTIDGYTKYYNTKHDRVGPLFQGSFKAIRVEDETQLLHLSRYIHLNPLASCVVTESDFLAYPWSSLPDYLGNNNDSHIYTDPVLNHFHKTKTYQQFILDHADHAKKLEEIKHLAIDPDV